MPISIDFLANVRSFLKGTDDAEQALDQVADTLDDIARDGDRSTEQLQRSFAELADRTKREMTDAASSTRRTLDSTTSAAKRNIDEIKNEAKQNAAETFSSFSGSAESFADGLQGTLGGLIASLPPQLAVLGAAGAIGIGLIVGELNKGQAETEQLRADTAELAQQYIDTGQIGAEWLGTIVDKLKQLATETDDGRVSLEDLARVADSGIGSFRDLAQAYAGNTDGLERLYRAAQRNQRALEDEAAALDTTTAAGNKRYGELQNQLALGDQYLGYLDDAVAKSDKAAAAEANYAAAGGPDMERKAQLISAVNDAYDETASSVDDYVNAETGIFDVTAYITAMTARSDALKNYQETLATSGLSPEAQAFLSEQGADAAAAFLAGYKTATPEQQAELERIWTEAGQADSATYAGAIEKSFQGKTVTGPSVVLAQIDPAAEVDKIQRGFAGRTVRVAAKLVTRSGQEVD